LGGASECMHPIESVRSLFHTIIVQREFGGIIRSQSTSLTERNPGGYLLMLA
jgi:hypothetical protein